MIKNIMKNEKYLAYIELLSEENYDLLISFKDDFEMKAELVCDSFRSKVEELLFGDLCFEDFNIVLTNQMSRFIADDINKRWNYLSWKMWRLAMSEWDDKTSSDTPILKKEIIELIRLMYL